MKENRPFAAHAARLRAAGLRPTRQRLGLARLLFEPGDWHLTAEKLHDQAAQAGLRVSLATIYNTLNQFTAAGLLREVVATPERTYFDTNTSAHHHIFDEDAGELSDIPGESVTIAGLPGHMAGKKIMSVEVVVRVKE